MLKNDCNLRRSKGAEPNQFLPDTSTKYLLVKIQIFIRKELSDLD
jgi:hypothetical protein